MEFALCNEIHRGSFLRIPAALFKLLTVIGSSTYVIYLVFCDLRKKGTYLYGNSGPLVTTPFWGKVAAKQSFKTATI